MDRINRILAHPLWQENMARLRLLEQNRIFCGHDTPHLLDVARLAYIENLENQLEIPKVLIYAAALLHDLGRAQQYTDGTPHDQAGAALARQILPECGFSQAQTEEILTAILAHRCKDTKLSSGLPGILYRADKASRMCMFCQAKSSCNWSDEKKNLVLRI